jgi:hypothetical protein
MRFEKKILVAIVLAAGVTAARGASAEPVGKSDLTDRRIVTGVKWPNSPSEGTFPVRTEVELAQGTLGGFSELVPYVVPSPDQEDAGSCLYMSLTGIAEWWLARLHPNTSRAHDGPIDLSERYMMNVAGIDEDQSGVQNWKTDSIFLYNKTTRGALNSAYRFTKGWYTTDAKGDVLAAEKGASGAEYGTEFNWIDQTATLRSAADFVTLPTFDREVIFADPASNQWNTGVMPSDIVDRVKTKLARAKAPVNVIYNHFGYWHSVFIVGYDDDASSNHCSFVESFDKYMPEQATELRKQAAGTTDAAEKAALLARADKFDTLGKQFHDAYVAGGGCSGKGVFYVRDSIYADASDPYVFDPSSSNGTGSYSKAIVMHEYEWLRYMANHATQILVK